MTSSPTRGAGVANLEVNSGALAGARTADSQIRASRFSSVVLTEISLDTFVRGVCFLKHSLCVLGSSYLLDCAKFSLMCVIKEMKVINQTLLRVSLHFVEIYLQGLRNSNILKPMLTFKARWKIK